jgi:hypothetical protein
VSIEAADMGVGHVCGLGAVLDAGECVCVGDVAIVYSLFTYSAVRFCAA